MSDHSPPSGGPRRRTVLAGLAAAGAAAGLPGCAATPAQTCGGGCPADFLAGSSRLTGIQLDGTYNQMGAELWAELVKLHGPLHYERVISVTMQHDGDDSSLAKKLEFGGLMDSAQRIIRAWYTGMVEIPDSGRPGLTTTAVVTYNDAVVWRACDFTKPPATCGGPFGYWHEPPQA